VTNFLSKCHSAKLATESSISRGLRLGRLEQALGLPEQAHDGAVENHLSRAKHLTHGDCRPHFSRHRRRLLNDGVAGRVAHTTLQCRPGCHRLDVCRLQTVHPLQHRRLLVWRSGNGVRHINESSATSSPVSTGIGDDLWRVYTIPVFIQAHSAWISLRGSVH